MHCFFLNVEMRKLIIGVCLLGLMNSCEGGRKKIAPFEKLTEEIDSQAVVRDTTEALWAVEEEAMVPATADESFVDFFYNFTSSDKLQLSRIVFPLPYYTMNEKRYIEKDQWEYDSLFSLQDAYTVLFDREEDMEMEKDTSMTSVKVEWIYLKQGKLKRYYFERLEGVWKLEAIDFADIVREEKTDQEDFFEFYERFVNDSVFQLSRLHEPLKFVTADPEDEFQILETTLEAGQWFAFQPALPRENLTNIIYGQNKSLHTDVKIIELKGLGNGFSNTLYFKRRNGVWKLTQFEDLSD